LTTKAITAIKGSWPYENWNIVTQQDRSSSQIEDNGPDFVAEATMGLRNLRTDSASTLHRVRFYNI
jgi:hypothetical protein